MNLVLDFIVKIVRKVKFECHVLNVDGKIYVSRKEDYEYYSNKATIN